MNITTFKKIQQGNVGIGNADQSGIWLDETGVHLIITSNLSSHPSNFKYYQLSTPFDVRTMSSLIDSGSFGLPGPGSRGIALSQDGTKFISVYGIETGTHLMWGTLSTPFHPSTLTIQGTKNIGMIHFTGPGSGDPQYEWDNKMPAGLFVDNTGTYVIVATRKSAGGTVEISNNSFYSYPLSSAWDVTTILDPLPTNSGHFVNAFSDPDENFLYGISFSPDGMSYFYFRRNISGALFFVRVIKNNNPFIFLGGGGATTRRIPGTFFDILSQYSDICVPKYLIDSRGAFAIGPQANPSYPIKIGSPTDGFLLFFPE